MKKININIIPTFHYDISYLKTCAEYLEMCMNNIHQALNILEEFPEYYFTLEQVYLLKEFWNRNPDRRRQLKEFIREGRLSVAPGMLAVPDMNMPDGESMYMQVKIGKEWLKKTLDIEPDVCYIADCWGHHAQLPQIMKQSGYNYYIFWRCMRRDVMLNDFIWQGLDGTQINTHWLARGYGGLSFPADADKINVLDLDFAGLEREDIIRLCEDIQQYGNTENIMLFNGGDFAFPQISAPCFIRKYNKVDDEFTFSFSTPEKHLKSFDWSNKKIIKGEFNTYEQGTFVTNIRIKQQIRRLVNKLHALEKISVFTGNAEVDYTHLWEIILKQQFHDIICGTICDGALTDTYSEMQILEKLIYEESAKLEDVNGETVYFNTQPFERQEAVELRGKKLLVELKPFGFAKVSDMKLITAEKTKITLPCSFENNHFKAEIGIDGYISSLISKNSKYDLVGYKKDFNGKRIPFGHICMQMDYGDSWLNFEGPISGGSIESSLTQNKRDPYFRGTKEDIVNKGTFIPVNIKAEIIEKNQEQLIVEQQGEISFWKIKLPVKTKVTFAKSCPYIKYETTILPEGKNFRVRAAFPTNIEEGNIRYEIPYGIQERKEAEFPAQNWIDYSDENGGLALFNNGIPSNTIDDGIIMLNLFRSVAMEYKTASYLSYNEGITHKFEYAVMPHSINCNDEIIKEAYKFTNPVVLTQVELAKVNELNSFVTDNSNIIISGLRWQKDKVFLRVYEACGSSVECVLRIPDKCTKYAIANGLQQPIDGFRNSNGKIGLKFRAFEIKNILLTVEK